MFVQLKQMLKRDKFFLGMLMMGFLGFTIIRQLLFLFLQKLGNFDSLISFLGVGSEIIIWLLCVLVCWRATQSSFKKQWGAVCMCSVLWLIFCLLFSFWFVSFLIGNYHIIHFFSHYMSTTIDASNIWKFEFFVYNSVLWSLLYALLAAFWEKRGLGVSLFRNFGKFVISYVIIMIVWYGISSIINFISANIPTSTYHSYKEIPLYISAIFGLLRCVRLFSDMIIVIGMIYILTAWKRVQQDKANNLPSIFREIKHSH